MSSVLKLEVNGIAIAVTEHGGRAARRRRPLILAHATGFCGAVWRPIASSLSDQFRVFTIDQRGHGDSDKPVDPGAYSWRLFVEDLAQVIETLGLEDVIAAGHSKGGAAVAGVAARHPGRVARAILVDPVLVPRLDEPILTGSGNNILAEGARRRRMVWSSRERMFESFAQRAPFSTWREDVLRAYVEQGTFVRPDGCIELKCPGSIEAQVYEGAVESGSFDDLPRIAIPTLLIAGESSTTLPLELARRAAMSMRDCRLVVLPGVGHFVPMEEPDQVTRLIREFGLQDSDGSAASAAGSAR